MHARAVTKCIRKRCVAERLAQNKQREAQQVCVIRVGTPAYHRRVCNRFAVQVFRGGVAQSIGFTSPQHLQPNFRALALAQPHSCTLSPRPSPLRVWLLAFLEFCVDTVPLSTSEILTWRQQTVPFPFLPLPATFTVRIVRVATKSRRNYRIVEPTCQEGYCQEFIVTEMCERWGLASAGYCPLAVRCPWAGHLSIGGVAAPEESMVRLSKAWQAQLEAMEQIHWACTRASTQHYHVRVINAGRLPASPVHGDRTNFHRIQFKFRRWEQII